MPIARPLFLPTAFQNQGSFARPALPGVDTTTNLSVTPDGRACPSRASRWRSHAATAGASRVALGSLQTCRRHYAAHESAYRTGERVRVRHILFAVTPGVDVAALRKHAEPICLDVRCHDGRASERFADAARKWSNCPSGEHGGELGWLSSDDCAPEFARELFGHVEVGVLPRLVHSRFGLHVVEVLEREPGVAQPFESVQGAVAMSLRQQIFVTALRQYLRLLAGQAVVQGVALEVGDTPLVQ